MMNFIFDMDGTIADLYHVENWLPKLRAEDASPYVEAQPMWDMDKLGAILEALQALGHRVTIVSWLSIARPAPQNAHGSKSRFFRSMKFTLSSTERQKVST